jgi:hypothetical protein
MKLLYYSPDDLEIAEVSKQFAQAGIPCVVRHSAVCRGEEPNHACAELWIRNDKDTHKAMMLCVQLGVGFAKRDERIGVLHNWSDLSTEPEAEEDGEQQHRTDTEPTCLGRRGPRNGSRLRYGRAA